MLRLLFLIFIWIWGVNVSVACGVYSDYPAYFGDDDVEPRIEYDGDIDLLYELANNYPLEDIIERLDRGADIHARDGVEDTPLHYAVQHRYSTAVTKELLSRGAEVNARANDGSTPLHGAVNCDPETVQLLVDAGADILAKTKHGKTPYSKVYEAHFEWIEWLDAPRGENSLFWIGEKKLVLKDRYEDTREMLVIFDKHFDEKFAIRHEWE